MFLMALWGGFQRNSMTHLDKFNNFILKEHQTDPPFANATFNQISHRWEKQNKQEPVEVGMWNTQKTCSKCGWNKKMIEGREKDKFYTNCPKCGNKDLKREPFSPDF
jgi:transposase